MDVYTTSSTLSSTSDLQSATSPSLPTSTPPPSTFVSSSTPIPTLTTTTKQDLWGWACNSTNNTRAHLFESASAPGCSETFVLPSSTQISMNLSVTVTGNSTEPTRTFSPIPLPTGLGVRQVNVDGTWSGIALVMVLGAMVGLI